MLYIDSLIYGINELPTVKKEIRDNLIQRLNKEGNQQLLMELQVVDPVYYNKMDKNNNKRLLHALEIYQMTGKPYSTFLTKPRKKRPFNIIKIGLNTERAIVYNRINQRVDRMMEKGLLEEARTVHPYKHLNSLNTVGYKELFSYFDKEITLEQAIEQIKAHTRKYARKQLTWYRKDSEIKWFDPKNHEEIAYFVEQKLSDKNS